MSDAKTFLDLKGPRVFTMPSGMRFLPALAEGIEAAVDPHSPYGLSDAMVLAPTRRAARALADAFVQSQHARNAVLLPRIRAIGDVDADEPPFEPGALALQSARPMGSEQRLFDLAALVQRRMQANGQAPSLACALAEAEALGLLISEAQTEEIDGFDLAKEKFQTKLNGQPEHVQRAAQFLSIVMEHWPAHLHAQGAADPAAYRSFLLRALAENWRNQPPNHIIVAAGSTGSVPATAGLLDTVARLPFGAVVLPGLDESLSDADWKQVAQSPGHPQYGLARLLRRMGLSRADVKPWPGAQEPKAARRRRRLINEALLPAEATAGWGERLQRLSEAERLTPTQLVHEGLDGLSLVEADHEEEEALVLAMAIRHTLQDPQKTAILITPDRALAERVRAALWRWDINIDDSAGTALDKTPLGVFLSLLAQSAAQHGEPSLLASLLSSEFSQLSLPMVKATACARQLEAHFLRGVRRYDSIGDLRRTIEHTAPDLNGITEEQRAQLLIYCQTLEQAFDHFSALDKAPIAAWAEAHIKAAITLATSDEKTGDAHLWRGRAGSGAAALLRALLHDAGSLGDVSAQDYWHVFNSLAGQRPIRPEAPANPRARILGPLEARMIDADLVALGGLNEASWPSLPNQDPFLPRGLRLELGLPDPERRLGLAAHDFAEHASKPQVLLTRAKRNGAEPAVASRWLWRLKTLIRAAAPETAQMQAILAPDVDYLGLARALDFVPPEAITPAPAPRPTPPLEKRPRSLYVTRLKTLVRNPYAIYARFILNLEPLEPLGELPGPKERGMAVHDALEAFIGFGASPDDENALENLSALMAQGLRRHGFADHQIPAQSARLKRASEWILAWERDRRLAGWHSAMLEGKGALTLKLAGGDFAIKAFADRIDQRGEDFAVLDYKTGAAASPAEVYAGFDPQLPLEAAILKDAGFTKEGKTICGTASSLGLVKISGGNPPGDWIALEEKKIKSLGKTVNAPEFEALAVAQITQLVGWFDDPANPYLCQPRAKYTDSFSQYDELARRGEWASTAEDDGGVS